MRLAYSCRAMTTLELERTASEILTGGRIHATVAAAHVQWVRDYHGDDAVKELFWRLDRDAAHELTAEGAWISFASLIALDRAIVQKFGRGRRGFLRELGRYSAYLNLAGHATSNSSVPLCALCASVVNPLSYTRSCAFRSAADGPCSTWPHLSNRDPWTGQSHVFSVSFQRTMPPRCGQTAEHSCVSPDSSR